MESTGSQSSQQLHERQRLFHTLIENMTFREISRHIPMVMSGDFAAIELAKFSSDGFQTLNPFVGYDFIKHLERDKQNHQNIKISTITTIFAAADAYLDQHQKSFNTIDFSTIRAQLRDVETKLFDILPAIERTNASKNDDQDNMPDWMEELMREVPKQSQELHKLLEAINSSITAPDPRKIYTFVKESNSKHNTKFNHDTLINIGPETATLIQEMMHKISEIPFKGNKGQLLTFDELFKTADEKNLDILASFQLENQEGGTTAAGQLRTLKISERSSVELMKILHAMDSIHLRKLANALERHSSERIDAIRQGNVTKTSFEIQYEQQHPKSVAKQFFTASKNSGWHTTQLMQLQTLCHIAGGLDKAGYTPVTFNNTGVVRLENMFRKTSGSKSPIIRNPVSYDGGRAIALTGPNGSGKSFYQQSTAKAILEAHAFGYAPATTATMPIFDKVLYTDRVTKHDEDLSSFAQEIETWKTVHSIVEGSEGRVFIGIDEPFTTTSEKYQEALTYATISNFLANGKSYLSVATHNHKAIASLGQFVTPYHFKFEIGNNGFLKRHFHLKPGHAKSHAAAMARTLGFPREIVEDM